MYVSSYVCALVDSYRNSPGSSSPESVGDFCSPESHPKDVFVVASTLLHGIQICASLHLTHGSMANTNVKKCVEDIASHRCVTADIDVSGIQQLDDSVSIILEVVLHICLNTCTQSPYIYIE